MGIGGLGGWEGTFLFFISTWFPLLCGSPKKKGGREVTVSLSLSLSVKKINKTNTHTQKPSQNFSLPHLNHLPAGKCLDHPNFENKLFTHVDFCLFSEPDNPHTARHFLPEPKVKTWSPYLLPPRAPPSVSPRLSGDSGFNGPLGFDAEM